MCIHNKQCNKTEKTKLDKKKVLNRPIMES